MLLLLLDGCLLDNLLGITHEIVLGDLDAFTVPFYETVLQFLQASEAASSKQTSIEYL